MSETLESYCEYYKRPCTVSDGLCSECGERLIEPASGATEESPKTKGMTNGKQRVEEILQKYSNAVVDEVVEKCVGGGIVVFAERAKAKRLEALDSIEEVIKEVLGEGIAKFVEDFTFNLKDTNCAEFHMGMHPMDVGCPPIEHHRRSGRFEVMMELKDYVDEIRGADTSAKNQMGRWESK